MGNNEERKSSKPEKPSSPAPQDQTNIHVYPDWATMQAYYGHRVALPPYYNSAVASGHAPHPYMWGPPQPMMPPYGAPYAVYSHGGVYAHPAVPIGSHPHGSGIPSSTAPATPMNIETPTKSSAMSIGNGNDNADSAEGGERRQSQSEETEGSSDGNTAGGRKRSREVTPVIGGDLKTLPSSLTAGEVNSSTNVSGKTVGAMVSPGMTTSLPLRNPPSANAAKTNPPSAQQPCAVLPSEGWLQNERELKRERRKQSNRESARRSRLRKQAETEELAHRVESLTAENMALKSEINQLTDKSERLRTENAALSEKLKNGQLGQTRGIISSKNVPSTENLLSRVNDSASVDRSKGEEGEAYERNSNSSAKLHQLLDTSPMADAVAAG